MDDRRNPGRHAGRFEAIDSRLDEARRLAAEGEDRRNVAFAQLLQAIARAAEFDERQWQDAVSEASQRLEAEASRSLSGLV